ncbi:MAG: hypothetical protein IJJ26_11850 [Victivallales bacterium]|nr:hypothetical protein [Victivallales bacterium]
MEETQTQTDLNVVVPPLPEQDAVEIAKLHFACATSGMVLRELPKRKVTRVTYDGTSYIVKSYLRPWWQKLFHYAPDRKKPCKILHGLTPACLASIIHGSWQVAIYQDAGTCNLFQVAELEATKQNAEDLFREAGILLAKVHNRNVFHADTKPTNFVPNQRLIGMRPVLLVDCDRVIRYHRLPINRRAFNLAQFLADCKPFPSDPDRMDRCITAFLTNYRKNIRNKDIDFTELLAQVRELALNHPKIERYAPMSQLEHEWRLEE